MSEQWASAWDDEVVLRYPDPEHAAARVGLWCDLDLGVGGFAPVEQGWELRLRGLPVDRIEYLLVVDDEHRLDPTNPRVVPGAFGEHSWLPGPAYAEPQWLAAGRTPGGLEEAALDGDAGSVEVSVWSPDGLDGATPLPLLLSHDGPEMAEYGRLLDYVSASIAGGALPPLRVALLGPGGARDERYAAKPAYARMLTEVVVPELLERWPAERPPVLIGQSLGALAALHAAWTSPATFAGVLCQSGSFFTPQTDPQESGYSHFAPVTGFVAGVLGADSAPGGLPPVTIVCGSAEENAENNRVLAGRLRDLGVDVGGGEIRDGHTWTCWRDLLHPHLTDLLRKVWT